MMRLNLSITLMSMQEEHILINISLKGERLCQSTQEQKQKRI